MDTLTINLLLAMLVILAAYTVKGFSGFGPALVIVPFFTILYDPASALLVAAFFDCLAGAVLLVTVRRDINWLFFSVRSCWITCR
jgi:uncharacterized membrane protein YfcA